MDKKTPVKDYELSSLTMLMLPKFDCYGHIYTKVLEEHREVIVKKSPRQIIESACIYFGSTIKGRQDATREITGFTHKVPIAVEPYNDIYFFPTHSPDLLENSWLSHSHIYQIKHVADKQTKVIFYNSQSCILDVTPGSLNNQLQRTAHLRYSFEQRIRYLQDHLHYPQSSHVEDPKRYFGPFS